MSNLNQHIAAHNRAEEAAPIATSGTAPATIAEDDDAAALLTGNIMANKRYGCPASRVIKHELEGRDRCNLRFWRVYDVRRHLKADHGLDLEDLELRQLLGDVDAAEHGDQAHVADHLHEVTSAAHERGREVGNDSDIPIDPALMSMT